MIRQVITNLWNSYSCKKCHDLIHYKFNSNAYLFRRLHPTNLVTKWIILRADMVGFGTAIRVFDDRIWWWHCILLSQTLLAYNNFMKNSWNIIWSKVKGLLFIMRTKRDFFSTDSCKYEMAYCGNLYYPCNFPGKRILHWYYFRICRIWR